MPIFETQRGNFTISTDCSRLDIAKIHAFLSQRSYWAKGRSLDIVQRSIENSLCFGVFDETQQVGFARVVTDYVTFAWLCDVFILETARGLGLGKWLIETITTYTDLQGMKNFILATSDAHELYRQYGGFIDLPDPHKWMVRPRKKPKD